MNQYNNYNPYFQTSYNDNSFIGYYISDYNDVLRMPVSSSGQPTLFVNLNQGMAWSKKNLNGQSYIQAYSLLPINTEGTPKEENNNGDVLNKIISKLDTLEKDINNLKGVDKDESK